MSRRKPFGRTAAALLLLTALACDSDGGGGSPTEPLTPPNIAGAWSGIFTAEGGGTSVAGMTLQQSSGGRITGAVSLGGIVWSLEGTVNGAGRFEWDTTGSTCGSFDGAVQVENNRTRLNGTADLDRFTCPENRRARGTLVLQKETP